MSLLPPLLKTIESLTAGFAGIPADRKAILAQLAAYVKAKKDASQPIRLVFICTHNSRRSHMAQLWAQAAAAYIGIAEAETFSGGTEATAFYPAAVKAMQVMGFEVEKEDTEANPVYKVCYATGIPSLRIWSKRFDDAANPQEGFCAIMTCSDADENCPLVPGVEKRIAITYNDPKAFDNTPEQAEKYTERALQIGTEMLYAFSQV